MNTTSVCIINVFGASNRGDAAIFVSLVKVVKDLFPRRNRDVSISALARYATDMHWSPLLEDIEFYEPLFASYYRSQWARRFFSVYIIAVIVLWLFGLRRLAESLLPERKQQSIRVIKAADYVLSCGGAFLDDSSPSFILNLLEIHIAAVLGKPVLLVAQSIGPFRRSWARRFARSILSNVDYVLPRESWTERYVVDRLGIPKERVRLVPDLAFDAPSVGRESALESLVRASVDVSKPLVGMTVLKWSYPGSDNPAEMHKRYTVEMARFCDTIVDKYGVDIVFIPQYIRGPEMGKDDVDIAVEVRDQTQNQAYLHLLPREYTPDVIKGIIGCMTVFVGTRMHSNIFALSQNIPAMAISYLPKTTYIMEALELTDYVIDITEIDSTKLMRIFDLLWANRTDLSARLQQVIPDIQRHIGDTLDILLEIDLVSPATGDRQF